MGHGSGLRACVSETDGRGKGAFFPSVLRDRRNANAARRKSNGRDVLWFSRIDHDNVPVAFGTGVAVGDRRRADRRAASLRNRTGALMDRQHTAFCEKSEHPFEKANRNRERHRAGHVCPAFYVALYTSVYGGTHAACTRITVCFNIYIRYIVVFDTIYELFIEYSSGLYRICRTEKTVDNSGKSDVPCASLWITLWTVWKCMRLCTGFGRNEYTRMDLQNPRKVPK